MYLSIYLLNDLRRLEINIKVCEMPIALDIYNYLIADHLHQYKLTNSMYLSLN